MFRARRAAKHRQMIAARDGKAKVGANIIPRNDCKTHSDLYQAVVSEDRLKIQRLRSRLTRMDQLSKIPAAKVAEYILAQETKVCNCAVVGVMMSIAVR